MSPYLTCHRTCGLNLRAQILQVIETPPINNLGWPSWQNLILSIPLLLLFLCLKLSPFFLQANFQFYPSLFDTISAPAKDLIRFPAFYDHKLLKTPPAPNYQHIFKSRLLWCFCTINRLIYWLFKRGLLKTSPEERLSAEDILKHPWLQVNQVSQLMRWPFFVQDPAMIRRADCLMETQRRSRKRLLGEEVVYRFWSQERFLKLLYADNIFLQEAVGGEKRQRLEEVVVSRSSDIRFMNQFGWWRFLDGS